MSVVPLESFPAQLRHGVYVLYGRTYMVLTDIT